MTEKENKDLKSTKSNKVSDQQESNNTGINNKVKLGVIGGVLAVLGGGLIYGKVNDDHPVANTDPSSSSKVLPKTGNSSSSVIERYKDSEDKKKKENKSSDSNSIIDQITGGTDKSILDALDDNKKSPLTYGGRSKIADVIENAINGDKKAAAAADKKTEDKKDNASTPLNLVNKGKDEDNQINLDNPIVKPTPNPVLPGPEQPTPTPTPTPTPDPGPTPPTPIPDKEVTLQCQSQVMTHVGSSLNLSGYATATDSDGLDVSAGIGFTTNVNFNKEGNYSVTYYYVNGNGRKEVTMQVVVVNDAPIFNGIHDSYVEVGSSFDAKAGVSAIDTESGDLTSSISVSGTVDTETPGTYSLTYSVTDSHGKTSTVTRTVSVYANAPSFAGVGNKTIELGDPFDPRAGVTVSDNYGTTEFTVEGSVDTETAGTYELTYTAKNQYGKETTVTRTITVVAAAPVIDGVSDIRIEVGTIFNPMAGVSATDKYGAVTVTATTNNVDINKVGTYEVVYEATNSHGVTSTVKRKVEVYAEAPTLTVPGKHEVPVGTLFDAKSIATVSDKYGPVDISVSGSFDTSVAGLYPLTYTATNKYGVTSSANTILEVLGAEVASIPVPNAKAIETKTPVAEVRQTTPPVIAGAADVVLTQGEFFDDEKDVVIVDLYGNYTVDIVGTVNTNVPGTYKLTYTVTNIYGQNAQVVRTITVNPKETPVVQNVNVKNGLQSTSETPK